MGSTRFAQTLAPEVEKKQSSKMRALVFRAPREFGLEWIPTPKPGYGEAVIKVTLTTI